MPQQPPTATTTASRLKALLLYVDEHHGRAQSDALLVSAKIDRAFVEDETRAVPVEVWYRALVAFASRFGRGELPSIVSSIVHRENLGVWARVLRGAESPIDAFRQLSHHGGEESLTERWETIELAHTHWVGRVRVRATQPEERGGLCSLVRAAELSSIPLLFGQRRAVVTMESIPGAQGGMVEQRYRAVWARHPCCWHILGAAIGAVGAAALALWHTAQITHLAGWVVVGAILGLLANAGILRAHRHRMIGAAQVIRLRALERSAALRENRERHNAASAAEGTFIAGQYRLTSKLGSGASGAIWEATRLADGQCVAIKLLRAAVAHDTVAADRLRREAAALGLAWHPNVVEVYDDGHLPDGTSYLVMERLYGESLAGRLRRVLALPPTELLPIALQVCDALEAVHAAGIVHRDLKPSNIFLATAPVDEGVQGAVERVKLLDFGIARVEWAETRLTNAGAPLGTPGYMSPEQEQGLEIDARSDLFSLGSILFECLTGNPPPLTSSEFHSERNGTEPDSLVLVALQKIPSTWRRVIERATHPLPRNRYMDARSMREALAELDAAPKSKVLSSAARHSA